MRHTPCARLLVVSKPFSFERIVLWALKNKLSPGPCYHGCLSGTTCACVYVLCTQRMRMEKRERRPAGLNHNSKHRPRQDNRAILASLSPLNSTPRYFPTSGNLLFCAHSTFCANTCLIDVFPYHNPTHVCRVVPALLLTLGLIHGGGGHG